jgi:rhamnosyltransferase subunit B
VNILLIALGSSGDVNPFVGLGVRLRARGHRVTLITNGHFEPLARRAGLEFAPLGTAADYRAVLEYPEIWDLRKGFQLMVKWAMLKPMRPTYEAIETRNVPGETVMAAPVTAFGARVAQERLGIPLVTVNLQPAMLRSSAAPPVLNPLPLSRKMPKLWNKALFWLADVAVTDPLVARETNAFRAELGLPPARRFFDAWWFSPACVLGLFPEWFAPPQHDWPRQVRLTGFPLYDESDAVGLAPELAAFLDAGTPPIVFTPGSAMRHGRAFFEAAVDACRRLGRRGVLISPFGDQVPAELPREIRAFEFVPFSRIFPRAAAVAHHGGIGTSAQGLAAGVPQLIMPMAHDQPDNADRLERLGVARSLPPRRFGGAAVAHALGAPTRSPNRAASSKKLLRGKLREKSSATGHQPLVISHLPSVIRHSAEPHFLTALGAPRAPSSPRGSRRRPRRRGGRGPR